MNEWNKSSGRNFSVEGIVELGATAAEAASASDLELELKSL